jgi:hypothetical protein
MSDGQPSPFADHYTLFLDLLGFAQAVEDWDSGRAGALVMLLQELATARSSFDIDQSAGRDGSQRIRIVPQITTFSDHIVASFPLPPEIALDPIVIDTVLGEAQLVIASIAFRALGIGLLIRGGITYGKLFHDGRVVVGEAMNDAYRLERQVAIHPRVAVSERIYSKLPAIERSRRLLQDADGVLHVNYFTELVRQAAGSAGRLQTWCETIEGSIEEAQAQSRWLTGHGSSSDWTRPCAADAITFNGLDALFWGRTLVQPC